MDKAKLTQLQADALILCVKSRFGGREEVLMEHITYRLVRPDINYWEGANKPLNELTLEEMATALYAGYEVEQTPEEQVRVYYEELVENSLYSANDRNVHRAIVRNTLNRLNIKISGVND